MEKVRHHAYRPKPESPEMRFGKLLEPVMRAAYEEDTGTRVHAPGDRTYWASDQIRFAHLDGIREGQGIWEGKAPFQTWRNWADGPPAYVLAQVQHYLDISGEPFCDVSALAAGLDPIFQTFRVQADPATQANIATAVLAFWHNHVVTGEPPDVLPVAYEFPRHTNELMLVAGEQDETLARAIFSAKAEAADNTAEVEAMKDALKRQIGTAAGMVGDGWRIRYKANRDSDHVEWKLVAQAFRNLLESVHGKLADDDAEEALRVLTDNPAETIISLYTTVQPGARPFVLEEWEPK